MKLRLLFAVLLAVAFALPSGLAANNPKQKQKKKKRTIIKTSGWYTQQQKEDAKQAAKILGRPVAILWTIPGDGGSQATAWKHSKLLNYFVCIEFTSEGIGDPLLIHLLQKAGVNLRAPYPPYLLLGSVNGEYYGQLPSDGTRKEMDKTLQEALEKYGPLLSPERAMALWKKLQEARKLWKAEKYADAMKRYRDVVTARKVNPNLPVAKELWDNDRQAITKKGAEQLHAIEALMKDGKLAEAKDAAKKLYFIYKGFETANKAVTLYKEIEKAQDDKKKTPEESESEQEGEDGP